MAFTTTSCFTEPGTKPYYRNIICLLTFLHNCEFVPYLKKYFVVACTDDFDA
jgi:hypothetical protein